MRTGRASIAVIGCGNMGSAIVRGLCKTTAASSIVVCDHSLQKMELLHRELGVLMESRCDEAIHLAEKIIIAVKPKVIGSVLQLVHAGQKAAKRRPLIISIAGGVSVAQIKSELGPNSRVVRIMPNLASTVGCGVSGIFAEDAEDLSIAEEMFAPLGQTVAVSTEGELDVVTGLSASGPGFVFLIIEALAEGGVKMGLARDVALKLAAETVYGAGALARVSSKHPAELKDMVATPGGTTIAGLQVLENKGVRAALIGAVEASSRRAEEIRKSYSS